MAKEIWQPGNMLYPIPAVMVSCGREGETPNIVTVAWAGNICSSPAMLSISVRKERHSYDIIKETGEFVVNLTSRDLVKQTDWCGVRSGKDYDKFKEMNLTPQKSQKVSCPGIAESPVNIECKVHSVVELGSHDMFIAEVLCVTVDDRFLDDKGRFDLKKADLVAYSHGEYFALGEKLGKFGYSVAKKTGKKSGKKPGKKSGEKAEKNNRDLAGKKSGKAEVKKSKDKSKKSKK